MIRVISMSRFLISAVLAFALGCSTTPQSGDTDWQPDRVIARIDSLESRPDWLRESEPFRVEDGRIIALGETEIPTDHRLDAAYRIAANNAAATISGAVEKKLEFIFQNVEEGTGPNARQTRYIGAEATRLVTSFFRPGKRYWEKVVAPSDSGQVVARYRVFATIELEESEFKKAILKAVLRQEGKPTISKELSEKALKQWEDMNPEQKSEL